MRCLALAQTWKKAGGEVVFQTADLPEVLKEVLLSNGIEIRPSTSLAGSLRDAAELCEAARQMHVDWLVVDGYQFGSDYQEAIREAGHRLLMIDDCGEAEHYHANIVLNQNGGARAELYASRRPDTELLLGPKFALLRREFLAGRKGERAVPARAQKLLVTFGGADPQHVTVKAVESLALLGPSAPASTVLLGAGHPARKEVEAIIAGSRLPIQLITDTRAMAELMAAADFALGAPGTTCWEMAYMGVPMITIAVANNQLGNGRFLSEAGLARHLGWHTELTPAGIAEGIKALAADQVGRREMAVRGRRLVDGHGSFRVWLRLNADRLALRPVAAADREQVWQWANAPDVRAASFSSETIAWAVHTQWFDQKLKDPDCRFWIAEDEGGQAVGQIRFDRRERQAVISVIVDAACRGGGCGSLLIWLASRRLFAENDVELIRAFIKPNNPASIRAFERAGYGRGKDDTVRGQPAVVMILSRRDCT
jgi:UDP-2,4-diacetamido-2,4,6-trideoxy-beta-L-altropyranose hydrolase